MRKLFIFIFLALFISGFAMAQIGPGGTLYVSNRTVDIKASTGMFARTNGTLNYGDQVTVIAVNGRHVEVRSNANPSLTGWAASDNFTTRQVVASTTSTATASEVALAGKGFSQDVENAMREQRGDLDFDEVDRVETFTYSEADLIRFLEEGNLLIGDWF